MHELGVRVQNYTVDFLATNRQLEWPEISLVYDKSNKHAAIYDSNNLEQVSTFIQNVTKENVSNTYSVANELKYNISDAAEKPMLYKQFLAWNCKGCSIVPLTDYANNSI